MADKKYLDYTGASNLVAKIKSDFANKTHTHTKSEITDFPTIPSKTSELTNDSGFEANQNAFSNVIVDGTTIAADAKTDSLTFAAGNNVTITPDAANYTITISAKDTTYSAAGSSLGLVKSGGDVTISNGTITVNDDSHNHTISNVDGLQSALDSKAAASHTHNYAGSASDGGAANSAIKANTLATVTTAGSGAEYTAVVDGIDSLVAGANFIMIPHTQSTTVSPTLNVNNLGAKTLRQQLSNSTSSTTSAASTNWLGANKPVRVTYNGIFWAVDLVRPTASSLYGVVPIENGGTGANNAADARVNLGIETPDGTTTSGNADYAEVGEWADGNPDDEDRIGYFVAVDDTTAGTTMVKATSTLDVRGVTVASPAFSGNCSSDKFDIATVTEPDPVTGEEVTKIVSTNLKKQYDYVAVMGLVSVIDNGTCTINGRCMPTDDGTAVPSPNNMGYQIIDRIDATHVLIAVEPSADMLVRIKEDVTELQTGKANISHTHTSNNITAMTGYSKPDSASAISTSDSLNTAIGKLEKALDGKQASGSYASSAHSHSTGTASAAGFTKLYTGTGTATDGTMTQAAIKTALDGKAASSHGNHVPTTETANNARFLRNDNTWQTVTPANIGAATSSHNQASSTINAMTGYSKPDSTSAIATSDSLNAAIGKLEKALDGKQASGSYAAASHTHTKSQITDFPTSLKNPNSLTIKLNGSSQGAYDGSAAKEINITASSVGASAIGHTHTADTITSVNASAITGTIAAANLPSYVDDVIEGYYSSSKFYNTKGSDGTYSSEITGESGKIYIDLNTNKTYRWSGSAYVVVSETLALGETSSTAYRGDRGKTAYDHSQVTGNPHGTTIANISNLQSTLDSKAPTSHASSDTTYGVSSEVNYGHAKASSTAPKANGTVSVGTETSSFARGDHVHPLQTSVSGNAGTATKLQTIRTINGTNFDGSQNITTDRWGATRNIFIADHDASHTGAPVAVDGSDAATLKLPAIISATMFTGDLSGNATTATTATKLASSAGSVVQPVYFDDGKPVATTYSLNKTVPADAVFTDTKNTAGSTDTSSKIYLVGATSQAANPQTYSDNEVYATSGVFTAKSVQVGGGAATIEFDSANKCINFVFA